MSGLPKKKAMRDAGNRVASVPYKNDRGRGAVKVDPRKKALEKILAKEEQRAKKGRLQEILVQRLQNKYPGTMNKIVIISFVEEFVRNHAIVNEQDLVDLERDVRDAIKSNAQRARTMKQQQPSFNASGGSTQNQGKSSNQESTSSNSALPGHAGSASGGTTTNANDGDGPTAEIPSGKEWVMLQGYQQVMGDEKAKEDIYRARKKKLDFKAALDDHVRKAREMKTNDSEEVNYYQHIMTDIEKWKSEEKAKADKIHHKGQVQLEIQKKQILEKEARLAAEKKEHYDMQKKNLDRIAKEIKAEEEAVIAQRIARDEDNLRIKAANELNQVLQEEKRKELRQEDARLQREAIERSIREEKVREEAFAKRMKEMEKYGAVFAEEGAGKAKREAEIRMEQLLLRDQQAKAANDIAKENAKKEASKERTREALLSNNIILEKKRREREQAAEDDKKYGQFFENEIARFREDEQNRKESLKNKQESYKKILDEHVKLRSQTDVNLTGMDIGELKLNGDMIDKIKNDKSLYDRIQERLSGRDPLAKKKVNKSASRKPY